MHLLLVEDSPRMARTLRRALVEEGYAVTLAGDGRRALELARTEPFEAVLLDLGLPGLGQR